MGKRIDSEEAMVNQSNKGVQLNQWIPTLEALQNAFIRIYHWEIYVHILFTWKSKYSRGCCFYVIIFFDIILLF